MFCSHIIIIIIKKNPRYKNQPNPGFFLWTFTSVSLFAFHWETLICGLKPPSLWVTDNYSVSQPQAACFFKKNKSSCRRWFISIQLIPWCCFIFFIQFFCGKKKPQTANRISTQSTKHGGGGVIICATLIRHLTGRTTSFLTKNDIQAKKLYAIK